MPIGAGFGVGAVRCLADAAAAKGQRKLAKCVKMRAAEGARGHRIRRPAQPIGRECAGYRQAVTAAANECAPPVCCACGEELDAPPINAINKKQPVTSPIAFVSCSRFPMRQAAYQMSIQMAFNIIIAVKIRGMVINSILRSAGAECRT